MQAETVSGGTDREPIAASGPGCPIPVLVRDLMSANPMTVGPDDPIQDIAHVMLSQGVHSLPVLDAQQRLVGVVSEADLVTRECYAPIVRHRFPTVLTRSSGGQPRNQVGRFRGSGMTAEGIMTPDVIACHPGESAATATKRMVRHGVRCLPVLDHGRLVGVLSERDVLGLFDRPDPDIRTSLDALLSNPLWMPAGHAVVATVADGVVILGGSVMHPSDMAQVIGAVGQVPGVVDVVSRLAWRAPDPRPPRPQTPVGQAPKLDRLGGRLAGFSTTGD
ncbi:MAG TPA: CBS domain-containing protein [Acidimicrobiales bacterium]|nr:CBS domain-containing protein [Acidimicrobiales bacterium]